MSGRAFFHFFIAPLFIRKGFLAGARNDSAVVMLSEAKHPHRTGFLATLGMTGKGRSE